MDVETLRLHYARTLQHWSRRLEETLGAARAHAGEKRTRIWRLYLAGCAHAFERGWVTIQQVLAACKEFNVPCGYPASEKDIELRMKQGFSVFVMNWGDAGFRTVELGRKLSGRADSSR